MQAIDGYIESYVHQLMLNIDLSIRASAQRALCLYMFVLSDRIISDLFTHYRKPVDRLDSVPTTFRDDPVYKYLEIEQKRHRAFASPSKNPSARPRNSATD